MRILGWSFRSTSGGGSRQDQGNKLGEHNHKLKIADEFGFDGLETFSKEELARNDKEEKKIKAMRKEKKEKEEKLRAW